LSLAHTCIKNDKHKEENIFYSTIMKLGKNLDNKSNRAAITDLKISLVAAHNKARRAKFLQY